MGIFAFFLEAQPLSILLPTILICCLVYAVFIFVLYPLLLHPLRKIPQAHWTVRFPYIGSLWILYRRYRAQNNVTTHQAHLQHGPVVRLGYNEVSVNCVDDGIRTIYGGGWEKHEWYARQFAGYGVINMFSTVHHRPHSQKKRTMSNIYSKSVLQVSPQIKSNSRFLLADRFLPLLQSLSESSTPVDVHGMNHAFTMDFMSAYLFGIKKSTNFTQDFRTRERIMHLYHLRGDYGWHSAEVSPTLRRWLRFLRIPFVPAAVAHANECIEQWNTSICDAADKYLTSTHSSENPGDEPVVYKHFKTGMAKLRSKDPNAGCEFLPHIMNPTRFISSKEGLESMSRNEIRSEMYDHLTAGHETSAIALTYLYYELSRNTLLQDQLHIELVTLEPQIRWPYRPNQTLGSFNLPEPKAIDDLPFLNAIVMETLRLHAPIPGNEPRVSPHVPNGSKLGSFTGIPGGVRVSSMAYTLHRNTQVFPEPEMFKPHRWLTKDEPELKEMYRWFWAFGSGGRMCIGSHLAVQEIKLIVAAIYTNWTTEIVNDHGIEELDSYTTRPKSNKLILRFVHR